VKTLLNTIQGMFCHASSSERSATEFAWKRW